MTRFLKYSATVLLALAVFVPVASAHPRIFVGGTLALRSTDRRITAGTVRSLRPLMLPFRVHTRAR